MLDDAEKQSNRRANLIIAMASALLIVQVPSMDVFQGASTHDFHFTIFGAVLSTISIIGGIWVVVRGGNNQGTPATQAALEDELVKANRSTAMHVGYFAMLGATVLLFLLSLFSSPTARDVAHIILVTGVVAPMYTFGFLERRNA